jgi:hypothetical protein
MATERSLAQRLARRAGGVVLGLLLLGIVWLLDTAGEDAGPLEDLMS